LKKTVKLYGSGLQLFDCTKEMIISLQSYVLLNLKCINLFTI